jgi:hypothetical protein
MKNRYVFHEDPGHGWLEVDRHELSRFVPLSEISSFSYQKGGKVYLEEDCDAPLFLRALKESGVEYELEEKVYPTNDAPIRMFQRFCP